jgi:Domain of unknown function (DUF1772)
MLETAQFLAAFCASLFAGAALYISVAEHPARLELDTAGALAQWAPSYRRATLMQAPLAVVSLLAAVAVWLLGGGLVWLVAGVMIGAAVAFTFIGIMPTNRMLLEPGRDRTSQETRALLTRWGRLHAVRTLLGAAASVLMLWTAIGT